MYFTLNHKIMAQFLTRFRNLLVVACVAITVLSCNTMKVKQLPYPDTARCDTVDNYFGVSVADPYRWLEDDNSPRTVAWVEAENRVTFDYLNQIPCREAVRTRLTELWNYPKEGLPHKAGDYFFVSRNDGLQNQSVIYRTTDVRQKGEIFLDPNTLIDGGTAAVGNLSFSKDGRYMAYTIAEAGSDWVTIHVKETATGSELKDVIRNVKFSGASWSADSRGFYYSAYDAPTRGRELSEQNRSQKVFFHTLGRPQSSDMVIYQDVYHPLRYFSAGQSDDGRWLFVSASEGTYGTEIYYRAMSDSEGFSTLFRGFDSEYSIIYAADNRALVLTNDGAPNQRLVQVDLLNPPSVKTIIPEREDALLQSVSAVGGGLVATFLKDAVNRVEQFDLSGTKIRDVAVDGLVSLDGFDGEPTDSVTYFAKSSFVEPASVWSLSTASGKVERISEPVKKFKSKHYVTEQVFFTSADGTRVPMFLSYKKGLRHNGSNLTYLYGYGGFSINMTPGFSTSAMMLMEQGGIYAVVNLRGGQEYGEAWHRAGMLQNKQNVFDDFIAAAEYLIEQGYTSSSKLAIAGGSNGGLLVGACMTQRPDLYAVALPAVGVLDMLRYQYFTIGWGWAVEYGLSDNRRGFEYLYKYSPLHNVRKGVCYPATLITTGDHDDRVVPAHSFKFAATLQAVQDCDRPVLIRIDTDAGHGAGKPTSKRIDELTDVYSFMFLNTDTKFK